MFIADIWQSIRTCIRFIDYRPRHPMTTFVHPRWTTRCARLSRTQFVARPPPPPIRKWRQETRYDALTPLYSVGCCTHEWNTRQKLATLWRRFGILRILGKFLEGWGEGEWYQWSESSDGVRGFRLHRALWEIRNPCFQNGTSFETELLEFWISEIVKRKW